MGVVCVQVSLVAILLYFRLSKILIAGLLLVVFLTTVLNNISRESHSRKLETPHQVHTFT